MDLAVAGASCRICLDSKQWRENPFLSPCKCRGSVAFVHFKCLQQWRITNPPITLTLCPICKSDYTLPDRFLGETIPRVHSFSILEQPELWALLVIYGFCMHISFFPKAEPTYYEAWVPFYIRAYELVFFAEILGNWKVRQLRAYIQEWSKREGWTVLVLHGFLTLGAVALGNKYPYFLMPYTLGNLWRMHVQILQTQNNRLLRGIL
jgi:hypothetical protein